MSIETPNEESRCPSDDPEQQKFNEIMFSYDESLRAKSDKDLLKWDNPYDELVSQL